MLLYYAERTLTFGKRADSTSLAQITRGIFSRRRGEWIRGPAGLGPTAVKNANRVLSEKGFLIRRRAVPGKERYQPDRGNQATEYEINWTALSFEFSARRKAPLGHEVTEPLGHKATKALGRAVTNNRGKASSEEKYYRRKASRERSTEEQNPKAKLSSEALDEETLETLRSNPKAELAYLIHLRGPFLSEAEWWNISSDLEARGIDLAEFVAWIRPHLRNPKISNPIGFIKSKIRTYRA
jgi:hypothetical protein